MAATYTNGTKTTPASAPYGTAGEPAKGAGWLLFAGIMFVIVATLNVIWGIAAVSNSTFFVNDAKYILSDLNTWGWIAIGWGALEFIAALSIWRGGGFGRWFGIGVAAVAVPVAMLSIAAYPFWSLTMVAICLLIVYGLAAYGGKPDLTR